MNVDPKKVHILDGNVADLAELVWIWKVKLR